MDVWVPPSESEVCLERFLLTFAEFPLFAFTSCATHWSDDGKQWSFKLWFWHHTPIYRVSFLTGPASLGRDQFQSIEKLLHLLFYRSTFTFLVGILPSSTLRTFWGGTSQKRHPVDMHQNRSISLFKTPFDHTSYLSFLLHKQDFWKPNFTPKKTPRDTTNTKNVS